MLKAPRLGAGQANVTCSFQLRNFSLIRDRPVTS
jgi:hypothetical protein